MGERERERERKDEVGGSSCVSFVAVRRRGSAKALSSVLEKESKNSDDNGDLPSFSLSRFPRSRATSPLSAKDQILGVGIFVSPQESSSCSCMRWMTWMPRSYGSCGIFEINLQILTASIWSGLGFPFSQYRHPVPERYCHHLVPHQNSTVIR